MRAGYCKQDVTDSTGWHHYQCGRKASRDGYCGQHHPDAVKERAKKRWDKYDVEQARRDRERALASAERAVIDKAVALRVYETEGWKTETGGMDGEKMAALWAAHDSAVDALLRAREGNHGPT